MYNRGRIQNKQFIQTTTKVNTWLERVIQCTSLGIYDSAQGAVTRGRISSLLRELRAQFLAIAHVLINSCLLNDFSAGKYNHGMVIQNI